MGRHGSGPRLLRGGPAYALERTQFGTPVASFQLTQQKLVDMVLEIQKGLLSRCTRVV